MTLALRPIAGIRLGTTKAGVRYPDRRDLVLIELATGSNVAAVFTQNAFCAAPVSVAKDHLAVQTPRYLLINTGNANAGTGREGVVDAESCCQAVAQLTGVDSTQVLPFSTGVIGERLPVATIATALPMAHARLNEDGWAEAATGIMTTDTVPKGVSRDLSISGQRVTITAMAKGSGMIRPDMATMLAYIGTDVAMEPALLQSSLQAAADKSFNRITIDGDTSTNDACVLIATGKSGVVLEADMPDYPYFLAMLIEVCESLAQAMVRDGEGATKLITIEVLGGLNEEECTRVAYTVAHSPLVKTAFFASDPNWGRILAAVGRAGIVALDLDGINIFLDDVCIVRQGCRAADYTEQQGQQVMAKSDITIRIELARGTAATRIWTCDFSYDYVKINAEYRS